MMHPPGVCTRCGGFGSPIKKITRRKNGSVSSVTYDLKKECPPCKGTGAVAVNPE